jgi:predicted RNA binding protein YcfA (HicA-like mRNA interferase family)
MPESGKDLIKRLQKNGWVIDRQRGSHVTLIKGAVHVTVPSHNTDIPIGTYRKICKLTGVPPK